MKHRLRFTIALSAVLLISIGTLICFRKKSAIVAETDWPVAISTASTAATNGDKRERASLPPLAGEILLTPPRPLPPSSPTNAYGGPDDLRQYAQDLLYQIGNRANAAFRFHPEPLTPANSFFRAKCNEPGGLNGAIYPMNRRYLVSVFHNQIESYADTWFEQNVFRDPVRLEALSQKANYVSGAEAHQMAERALKILGLSDERLAALGKPVVQQQSWKEKDRLLPVFTVAYQRRIEADVEPSHIFRFEIMGIVPGGFISEFHNSAFDEKFLQIQLPFDYKEKVQKHLETSTDKKKRAFSY